MRSPLGNLCLSPMNEQELLREQQRLWNERGSLLITKDQIAALPVLDQFQIEILAKRVLGKGGNHGQ